VTIALGIIGPFGVVIAADSEEGTQSAGYLKSTTNKISGAMEFCPPSGHSPESLKKSIVISGSGDSGYLAAIKQHLIDDFKDRRVKGVEDADTAIRKRMKMFYKDHVIPFAKFSDLNLAVDLIIGVSFGGVSSSGARIGGNRLWCVYMNTVRDVPNFQVAAVGAGEQWVRNTLPVAASMERSVISAAAAYGIFFAKEHATGCGKKTRMALLAHGSAYEAKQAAIEGLENVLGDYSAHEKFMRNRFIGMPNSEPFDGEDKSLNDLRQRMNDGANDLWSWIMPPTPSTPQTSSDQP